MVGKEKPWNWKVSKLRKYRNLYLSQCWNSFRHVANAKKKIEIIKIWITLMFVSSDPNIITIPFMDTLIVSYDLLFGCDVRAYWLKMRIGRCLCLNKRSRIFYSCLSIFSHMNPEHSIHVSYHISLHVVWIKGNFINIIRRNAYTG